VAHSFKTQVQVEISHTENGTMKIKEQDRNHKRRRRPAQNVKHQRRQQTINEIERNRLVSMMLANTYIISQKPVRKPPAPFSGLTESRSVSAGRRDEGADRRPVGRACVVTCRLHETVVEPPVLVDTSPGTSHTTSWPLHGKQGDQANRQNQQ